MFERLTAGFRSEICPFCFEKYEIAQAPFRCANASARCAPEQDQVLLQEWEDTRVLGRVIPPEGRFARSVRCDQCRFETRKRLCPKCHMELPMWVGEARQLILSVIGASEAGKSHFIAVLIEQLKKHIGPALNLLLTPQGDDTIRRYNHDFYEPLYRRRETLGQTVAASADIRVKVPLVFTLRVMRKALFGGGQRVRDVITLVFFDTAGEDLNDQDTMARVNKYIYRSDGIILLLDPLQLPVVRDRLPRGTPLPQMRTETADILSRTVNLISAGRELAPKQAISSPLALSFSKFDALSPLLDDQLQLNHASDHRTGFDVQDHLAVHGEMESLLRGWDCANLVLQAKSSFKKTGFFAVSALGCNPHDTQQVPRVTPRRVEDPFLWLLHHHGIVPARKRV